MLPGLKNVNMKKLGLTVVVIFVYVFVTDWLIHGMLLDGMYKATPQLWRSESEMQTLFPWMILAQFLFSLAFCVLFVKGYEGKGPIEGVRFGIYITIISIAMWMVQYVTTPLTCEIVCGWALTALIQCTIAGAIASLVYKKK